MSVNTILAATALALLLNTVPLAAQPANDQEQSNEARGGQARDGADAAAKPDNRPAETGSAASQSNDSPFDYEASEEISEDLSVSFPVDI